MQVEPVVKDEIELLEDFDTEKLILPYGIGIDCHSRFIQVCILIRTEEKIKRVEQEFTVLWPVLEEARTWILAVLNKYSLGFSGTDFHYCIESTGTYHYPIVHCFKGQPSIVNASLTSGVRRKTDVLDARLLAYQNMSNMWSVSYWAETDMLSLKVLLGERRRHVRNRVKAGNRINNVMLRFGHTMFSKAGWGIYTRPLVEDIIANKPPDVNTVSPIKVPVESRRILRDLVKEWDYCHEKELETTGKIKKGILSLEFKTAKGIVSGKEIMPLLVTVPGIGQITAITWLSEIMDVTRFKNAKAIQAYCGCDPSLKVSAGKVTSYHRRKGNKFLHIALLQAASSLIQRKKEPFGNWGYRMYKSNRKGGWRKACAAVARRLCVSLFHVHRLCEPFDYEKYSFWREIEVPDVKLERMNLSTFTENKLRKRGLLTSTAIAEAYYRDLAQEKGIGKKCLSEIQDWIQSVKPDSGFAVRSSAEKGRPSRTRIWLKPLTASS